MIVSDVKCQRSNYMPNYDLAGKVAVVTGAARGIGAATVGALGFRSV